LKPAHSPVRVCFLIDGLAPAGTELLVRTLARELDRRRVQPALCLLDGRDAVSQSLLPENCPVLCLGIHSLWRPESWARLGELARFLRQQQVEVLHAFFPDSTLAGGMVGSWCGVPHLVRSRNNLGYQLTLRQRWLGRLLSHVFDATVTNCRAARESIIRIERPAAGSIHVLANGVDLERFRAPAVGSGSARRVGVLANLRPVKNLDLFIRVAADLAPGHPDVQFVIHGEGPERPALERLACALGLGDRLLLPGTVRDAAEALSELTVAVLCSESEGMSNALLEYMAAGLPIVATRVGAAEELIADGVHGLLVQRGDRKGLARALDRLLREPDFACQLGTNARARAGQMFSRDAMLRRYERFYHDLARQERPGLASRRL
jgi:glycosyltransferase involved in cell wall biosynthesis